MCRYRYIYYSRCSHCELTLVDHCDKAYERAGQTPPRLRGKQPSSPHRAPSTQDNSNESQAEDGTTEGEPAAAHVSEPNESAPKQDPSAVQTQTEEATETQQQTPSRTWASVARSAPPAKPGPVQQAKACTMPPVGPTMSTHGRSGSDSTIHAGSAKADLPEEENGKGAELDLTSPSAFPQLSPTSVSRQPSSVAARTLSPYSTSWAQIVRSASAERPGSSSASDHTAASDAVTPAFPKMAPSRASTAKTVRAKKPAPPHIDTTRALDSPRKRLPVEWTESRASSPEKVATTSSVEKPVRSHGQPPKTAHDVTSPLRSPTKTVPFELATARRAAAREEKEKNAAKIIPAVPKTLTKGKTSGKTHSKSASSDTSATQYYTAIPSPFPSNSNQSFVTAPEEPHQAVSSPGSPSRIPKPLASSYHTSSARPSPSKALPVYTDVRVKVTVSEPVSHSKSAFEETGEQDISFDTVKPSEEFVEAARSEMAKSDAAIGKASAALENIRSMDQPGSHVHFEEASKSVEDVPGLGVVCDSPKQQTSVTEQVDEPITTDSKPVGDQHPLPGTLDTQQVADTRTIQTRTSTSSPTLGAGHGEVEPLQPANIIAVDAAEREEVRSPVSTSTWAETSDISVSRGSGLEGTAFDKDNRRIEPVSGRAHDQFDPRNVSGNVVTESKSSSAEEQSSMLTSDESSQRSLHPDKGVSGSRASTVQNIDRVQSADITQSSLTTDSNAGLPRQSAYNGGLNMPRPLQGHGTTPSRLNAQAREFVPSAIINGPSSNTYASPSSHGYYRPPVPTEWQHQGMGAINHDAKQILYHQDSLSGTKDSFAPGKKYKKKKSPKKASNANNPWDRGPDRPHGTHHPSASGPGTASMSIGSSMVGGPSAEPKWRRLSAGENDTVGGPTTVSGLRAAAEASMSGGPSTGSALSSIAEASSPSAAPLMMGTYSSMPAYFRAHNPYLNIGPENRPNTSLHEITNIHYGQPRTDNEPRAQPYLGRGGGGIPTAQIPDGDHPFEKWWHDGYKSTDGGPLASSGGPRTMGPRTMGSWYDYLRQSGDEDQARQLYPTIFNPNEASQDDDGLREPNENGDRLLKTCGNIQMDGAFEAMPHYPLLCPKCQPDWHPSMAGE